MSVAFMPVYANPYQHLLSAALHRAGVEVEHHPRLPVSSWLDSSRASVDLLHLHWLSGLYMARFRTPIQVARFLRWLGRAHQLGYRIVWTAHNLLPHRRPVPPLHRWLRRVVVARADVVITHCEWARRELLDRFPAARSVHVIPHGHYLGVYPLDASRAAARSGLGIDSGSFVYLSLGNIARYKGIDILVDEFSLRNRPDERLLIAGRDRDRRLVRRLMAVAAEDPRIVFRPGFVPEEEIQLYLAAADVLVCPFREILGSGSVINGMSHGLPIIAPAIGCLPELVSPAAGLLYEPGDPAALGDAMEAARTWDLAKKSAASRSAVEGLGWDDIARRTLSVYATCLEPAPYRSG